MRQEECKVTIINLEKNALALWNQGNPDGFLELSSEEVVYFDPALEQKLKGKEALRAYYDTIRGQVNIPVYTIINPTVQASADTAVLTYDYEAHRDGQVFRMHCTEVYRAQAPDDWKIIHTHWSFVK